MKTFVVQFRSSRMGVLAGLLSIMLAVGGCRKNPTSADDNTGHGNHDTPRTAVPAELVGSWYTGTISTVNYYNPTTGQWSPPSGTGITYSLTADGYYEKSGLLQSSLYGCTTTLFVYNKGTVVVDGNKISLYPTYGRVKSQDNCVPRFNYDKPAELTEEHIFWELGTDAYGLEALWLRYAEGDASAFYRR